MTRAQRYLSTLMESVSEGHIASDEHRVTFARIRERIAATDDFELELRSIYKVIGFGDFALALMWISEEVDADISKVEFTAAEQGLVVEKFRYAVGDIEPAPLSDLSVPQPEAAPEAPVFDGPAWPAAEEPAAEPFSQAPVEDVFSSPAAETPETPVEETPATAAEESPEMPSHLQMETAGKISEDEQSVYAPPTGVETGEFVPLIEQFVESMQSGSDDREGLLAQVLAQANALAAAGSGAADDLREFCQYLIEFLNYIHENGFMDDVRVMNILSNVSSPVSSWGQASADTRSGLLTEAIEILKTFKSLFE